MYDRFIVRVKGLFLLGMLDATPVIGHAGVLRDLVVQILRMDSSSVTITPGALSTVHTL